MNKPKLIKNLTIFSLYCTFFKKQILNNKLIVDQIRPKYFSLLFYTTIMCVFVLVPYVYCDIPFSITIGLGV